MLRKFATLMIQPSRSFKSDLKLKWIKPAPIECYDARKSGDLESLQAPLYPTRSQPILQYTRPTLSPLLNQQPAQIKALFSVGNIGDQAANQLYRENLADRVRQHKYDDNSMEVRIAMITGRIRVMQVHLAKFRRDGHTKTLCKELIDRRKKYLKYLRKWDYKRFEWLLEKLQLEYKPPPPAFRRITRKQSMTKLKDLYCEDIKEKRMAEYKKQLLAEREALLKEFAENPLPPLKSQATTNSNEKPA